MIQMSEGKAAVCWQQAAKAKTRCRQDNYMKNVKGAQSKAFPSPDMRYESANYFCKFVRSAEDI